MIVDRLGSALALGTRVPAVSVLLAALALAVAACGGAAQPGGGGTATQASGGGTATDAATDAGGGGDTQLGQRLCGLVPVAEVQTLVGGAEVTAEPETNGCQFNIAGSIMGGSPEPGLGGGIHVRREGGTIDAGPRVAFPGGQDIPGIGDKAYWAPDANVLYFERGGETYAVQLVLLGDETPEQSLEIARAIATRVASGL